MLIRQFGAEAPVLDPVALAKLVELAPNGGNRFIARVLETFLGTVARMRPQFDAGRRTGRLEDVKFVAHTLKSSSAIIGAKRLSECCAAIESAIRLERLEELPAPLSVFDNLLDEALQAIDDWLRGAR